MFLITNGNDVIYYITSSCNKESDGSYIIDNGILRVLVPESFIVHEVDSLKDDIEPYKHCYSESKGFYANSDYVEPVPEPTMADLQEQIAELSANLDYMSMVASVDLPNSEEE
ncbi:hypothetical protein KQI85_07205 [Falcatimonas sp. MSJ-15]|uniref:hypothetical protein n=1 Tax=Falcatimonas sp. MSJ-15 TaxID=2841515 RepID=UPI001C120BDC|nr:hypothetical protein [Falcatimonas sp. MSJ-15]MBU5470155.1 hypothetical protein [Falcatimonas sp. MSJ-15]